MSGVYQANERCVFCGESTAMGSGRFVNRVPTLTTADMAPWLPAELHAAGADLDVEGYACVPCLRAEEGCACGVCLDCDGTATENAQSSHPTWCDWCATGHGQESLG